MTTIESGDGCFFCDEFRNRENVIYENGVFRARIDLFPVSPGHVEVLPKKHIISLLDLTKEDWVSLGTAITEAVHLVESISFRKIYTRLLENPINDSAAIHYRKMLNHPGINKKPDGWNYGVNDGETAGRTIPHLHVHIIPRFEGDVENPKGGIRNIIPGMGNYS